ncbi:unnamed protein product, partial [Effrenium voratum]
MGGRATATTSGRTASRRAASRRAASRRAASRRAASRRAASRRAAWTRAAPPCRSCWADGGINVRPAPGIRRMRTSRASSRTCSCSPASSATKASAPTTRGPSTFLRAPCRQRGAAFVCLASRKPRASWRSTRTLPRSVRQGCRQQREERGTVLRQKALRDGRHATVEESWAQCLECEAGAISSCQVCGTKLCPAHIEQYPPDVSKVRRLWVCRHCRKYSAARAAAGKAVRDAAGLFFRRAVAAESSAAELIPAPLEEAEDCAACGLVFSKLPGSLRHHCRACGRSLCAGCLCGAQGCLVNAARCPHKARLYGKEERICKDCLPVANCRIEARGTCAKVYEAAARYAEHCLRVRAFLADPEAVPLYEANFVDTVQDKLLRAGGFAVEGAKRVAPFVSLPWSVGVRAVDVVWNYGQYGLLGILMREEIMQGIKTLLGFSSALQDIPPKDLLVGLLYLSAEQRKALRDAPEGNARLCRALGRPAPPKLLEALLGMALLGTFAPYQDTAFEVQRFALQQQWRLVAERLESWKHRPAWALFLSHAHRTAALSIRGTDVEQSRGGDLFTDFDALGVGYGDDAAPSLLAHQGALQAAQALETELRPTLRALGQAGYRVILTGHSLGGAVAALLLWLLKHGTQGERLEGVEILGMGYATPAVVDLKTAEELRPHFTSLVNSMDAVPRLCRSALQRLAHELKDIASGSAQDLDQDLQHYLDRLTSVWAPRFRDGLPLQEIPSHRSEEELTDLWGHHEEEESELYIPGSVVWIHRVRGRLDAALVPCTAAPLRRLLLDKRMIEDHSARSIHQALLAVERAAKSDPSDVKWQKFCDAGERCPCCGSRYEWMNTARSGKMRAHAMTNCRVCGLVVCVGCAASRRSLPELSME